jgi:hypothetical protein
MSNVIGRVTAEPIALDRKTHEIIKNNMISIIEAHSASPEDINEALKVSLKFSENHKLEDASDLDIVIRQMQNPPKMTHPVATILASLAAKKQNSPD